jgi:glucose/arabinose dehydrogenase
MGTRFLFRFTLIVHLCLFYHLSSGQPILPEGFVPEVVFTGIECISMAFAPGDRIFVSEKKGNVYLVQNGTLIQDPILTLPVDDRQERGLLGIAVDPEFEFNNYIYVYYTVAELNHNRLSRFVFQDDHIHLEDEEILIDFDPLGALVHNGGDIKFGLDGKLYVATGDGYLPTMAQSQSSLLGKILRINPDGSIPTDNPFYFQNQGIFKSIYATGLRNPFTFSFSKDGKLFANDVGSGRYEEVNNIVSGKNYGWPIVEGMLSDNPGVSPPENYVDPVYAYSHDIGCAITGSAFYSSEIPSFPAAYEGKYLFGDFCNFNINVLDPETGKASPFFKSDLAPIFITVSDSGELYYMTFNYIVSGTLWKITYSSDKTPKISSQPRSVVSTVGESPSFMVQCTGEVPLTYQWLKNGIEIPDANEATLVLENISLADQGDILQCHIENAFGSIESESATLTVTERQRPAITFDISEDDGFYIAGDTIVVKGTATDEVEGILPKGALNWVVNFQHNFHYHPVIGQKTNVDSIGIAVPRVGETSTNVWYRVYLTAVNSIGLSQSSFIDVFPKTANITFSSNLENPISISLDGTPIMTPSTFSAVVGMTRNLTASNQYQNDQLYSFSNWNNELQQPSVTFNVYGNDTTFIANYEYVPWGQGTGLTGRYYNEPPGQEDPADLERIDERLDFDWQNLPPAKEITTSNYDIIWQGYINIPLDGEYTFRTIADGGISVSIADTLIINEMENDTLREFSNSLVLEGGVRYPILIKFHNNSRGILRFLWSIDGLFPRTIVPQEALYDISNKPIVRFTNELPESFSLGDAISVGGEGTDSGGIPIPENNFAWTVYFVRPDKTIMLHKTYGTDSLFYEIPDSLSYFPESYLRVQLDIKDSKGFLSRITRDLNPIPNLIRIESNVGEFSFSMNDLLLNGPQDIEVIRGYHLSLKVIDDFSIKEKILYLSVGWPEEDNITFHVSGDTTILLNYLIIPLDNGYGLTGEYFSGNNNAESIPDSVKIDEQLDHHFNNLSGPLKVKWSGFLVPPINDNYTIVLDAKDYAEMRILENSYITNDGEVSSEPLSLKKGHLYPIQLDYEINSTDGAISLSWLSGALPEHIIPMYQLYPELTTGFANHENPDGITIYPNPTSDFLNIELSGSVQYSEVTLTNVLGVKLFLLGIDQYQRKPSIDLRNLIEGVYFLKLKGNNGISIFKVLKY